MLQLAKVGSSAIFLFLTVLLVISRIPITDILHPLIFILAATAITVVICLLLNGRNAALMAAGAIVCFMAIILLWAVSTQYLYDAGHDGHSYHLTAIWDLADGWSPFFSSHDNIWVDSYPSGYWALQSYLVSTTGLLLSGKSLTIGLMVAVGLLAYDVFLEQFSAQFTRFNRLAALAFAVIVVANPVVLTQLMTHYIDGSLYLLGSALVLFLISDALTVNRLASWSAIGCIILMVNTKTAALYYVPLVVLSNFLIEGILKDRDVSILQYAFGWIRSKGIPYGLAFIIGIAVIGYKPYFTNMADHGEFLYPSVDKIMATNIPVNLEPLPVPVKFLYGIFSRTEDSVWPVPVTAPVNLKVPGTLQLSEFKDLDFDTRRGGFGPFFSLSLILSIAAYGVARFAERNDKRYKWHRNGNFFALFGAFLIGMSIFFPESWWARYIPFVWTGVMLIALSTLFLSGRGKCIMFSRILLGLAFLCFAGNIAAGTIGSIRQSWHTYQRTALIEQMKAYPVIELFLIHDPRVIMDYQSTAISYSDKTWTRLLNERGVNTRITKEFNKENCEISGFFDGNVLWCARKQ